MRLAERQQQFMTRLISAEDQAIEFPFEKQRTAVYLNNYRTALVEALKEIYGRTLAYVTPESFERAAVHYLVTSPSTSWSLDHIGEGFSETLRDLYLLDPEVAELAELEWTMHEVFVAADASCETLERFGERAKSFSDEDWIDLCVAIIPAMRIISCKYDLVSWWNDVDSRPTLLPHSRSALVWREHETPVFVLIDESERRVLEAAVSGKPFGDLCDIASRIPDLDDPVSFVACLLRSWLERGLIMESAATRSNRGPLNEGEHVSGSKT